MPLESHPCRTVAFQSQGGTSISDDLAAAEREMTLSRSERAALAALVAGETPTINERVSVHARLLLSEIVITVHLEYFPACRARGKGRGHLGGGHGPGRGATSGAGSKMALQAYIANLGVHLGLQPQTTLADVYCQAVRLDALVPGAPSVPLVSRVPAQAVANRRKSSLPIRIPLEVDTTAAFAAAGIGHLLPALCMRSDAAHTSSAWQLGLRWHSEQRLSHAALDAASIDAMAASLSLAAGAAPGGGRGVLSMPPPPPPPSAAHPKPRSEIALRWRSSQQLAILVNHHAIGAGAALVDELSTQLAAVDPTTELLPRAPVAGPSLFDDDFGEGDALAMPQAGAAIRARGISAPRLDEPLRDELRPLEAVTVRLSIDMVRAALARSLGACVGPHAPHR